ncbi:3-oxoacyl-ACP synthase [Leadbetterella sp. DM7]|uniref:3-oxoacyl-ACP synthase n=1 Tax=Leadbetterella sp. DM7 TaxID=3235085 RepID=UPI00349EB1EF
MDKHQVVTQARVLFGKRLDELEQHILSVQQSANQESKSSMGDKYETGRAMAHNEVFMLRTQLENLGQELRKFEATDFTVTREECTAGSLVQTGNGWFLLSAALGKVTVSGRVVMCISLDSPLGRALAGKKKGELFLVNGREGRVLEVS